MGNKEAEQGDKEALKEEFFESKPPKPSEPDWEMALRE